MLKEARPSRDCISNDGASVAVVIPTFNHVRFLADAINSVLAQTRPADEIIVVDDGSSDDPATVVGQFKSVKMIRQDNRGPAAARNTGLRNCKTTHVVFLDADDRLLPNALDAGLGCIAAQPNCAFVYGGYRLVSQYGQPIAPDCINPIGGDAHLALLRRNLIGNPASVLFRRDRLLDMNGFDETLRRLEDYEIYLRFSQVYPIASHAEIVVEYRRHEQNISNDYVAQLRVALQVLDLHEARIATDAVTRAALRDGRQDLRNQYLSSMLGAAAIRWRTRHDIRMLARDLLQAACLSPFFTIRALFRRLWLTILRGKTT